MYNISNEKFRLTIMPQVNQYRDLDLLSTLKKKKLRWAIKVILHTWHSVLGEEDEADQKQMGTASCHRKYIQKLNHLSTTDKYAGSW